MGRDGALGAAEGRNGASALAMADANCVVHIIQHADDELGRHLADLTGALAARGFRPIVVGPLERSLREELTRHDARWVNMPLPAATRRAPDRAAVSRLLRFLEAAAPVVIHVHGLEATSAAAGALRGVSSPPPLVCSPYGVPALPQAHLKRAAALRGLRRTLAECAAVTVTSEAERGALLDSGMIAREVADRLTVVPPGVEPRPHSSLFDIGQKRLRVGLDQNAAVVATMAPLEPGVPLEDFLRAASLVSEAIPNVEFAVLGAGARQEELKQLAHSLRLSGSAVFLGKRRDSREVMSTCNVYAALWDGVWGAAHALEALARGLRVVATDAPGLREVFQGVTSVPVVPVSEHQAFADALRQQLEHFTVEEDAVQASTGMAWVVSEVLASRDEFDLDQHGLEPRDRTGRADSEVGRLLEHHSVDRMASATIDVYQRVMASR
jgi:glycosyltransferase involved in cell wall biosynthesis